MNSPIAVYDLHPNPGTEGPVELPPLRSTDLSLCHGGDDDVGHVRVLIGFEQSSQLKNFAMGSLFIPIFFKQNWNLLRSRHFRSLLAILDSELNLSQLMPITSSP